MPEVTSDVVGEFTDRVVAIDRLKANGFGDDRPQVRRNRRRETSPTSTGGKLPSHVENRRRLGSPRETSGENLVKHDAQRIDVTSLVRRVSRELLRREIRQRSDDAEGS